MIKRFTGVVLIALAAGLGTAAVAHAEPPPIDCNFEWGTPPPLSCL
ncbi:hypothetical protein [Nonomuraea sp. LPB2021202275-12-8]